MYSYAARRHAFMSARLLSWCDKSTRNPRVALTVRFDGPESGKEKPRCHLCCTIERLFSSSPSPCGEVMRKHHLCHVNVTHCDTMYIFFDFGGHLELIARDFTCSELFLCVVHVVVDLEKFEQSTRPWRVFAPNCFVNRNCHFCLAV